MQDENLTSPVAVFVYYRRRFQSVELMNVPDSIIYNMNN